MDALQGEKGLAMLSPVEDKIRMDDDGMEKKMALCFADRGDGSVGRVFLCDAGAGADR